MEATIAGLLCVNNEIDGDLSCLPEWSFGQERIIAQIHGSTLPVAYESLQLGVLDPDAINPDMPKGKAKVFGSIGSLWIDKTPPKSNSGCSITIPTPGEIPAGMDVLAMDLRYGKAIVIGGSGSFMPTNTNFRVTLSVRVDPLSDQEKQMLLHQSNFNEAYKVDD